MTTLSPVYHNYIFGEVDDADRLQLEHSIYKAHFEQIIDQVLDNYSLADRLKTNPKSSVLDIGCAEGLYLHDVAGILEKRGLLDGVSLNGFDLNPGLISVADEFRRLSQPPRPYLNFYVGDATQPLKSIFGLSREAVKGFDFIYIQGLLALLPNAQEHLAQFYTSLKPGGVIYVRDPNFAQDEDRPIPAHPITARYSQTWAGYSAQINPNINVPKAVAGWLEELGATQVAATLHKVTGGGPTKEGMLMLRNVVMLVRNVGKMMVKTGQLTAAQQQADLDTLFRELNSSHVGQVTYVDTLARKPLE